MEHVVSIEIVCFDLAVIAHRYNPHAAHFDMAIVRSWRIARPYPQLVCPSA